MNLVWVKIKGYKRFEESSILRTNGRLVAIVGPNEAGKTSLLRAIKRLDNNEEIPVVEATRGAGTAPEFQAAFYLNDDDLAAARLTSPTWLRVKKVQQGQRQLTLDPQPANRDIRIRKSCVSQFERVIANRKFMTVVEREIPALPHAMQALVNELGVDTENLNAKLLQRATTLVDQISELIPRNAPAYVSSLPEALINLVEAEGEPSPTQHAMRVVESRLPRILEFEESHRRLETQYDLAQIAPNPPDALKNLATIAKLNLPKLLQAAQTGIWSEKRNILDAANQNLANVFSAAWSQSKIEVHFEVEGTVLKILIKDVGKDFIELYDRSDGLRQFVALYAFTTVQRTDKPILLIDEAETHLHYDGQADLVQVLTSYDVTQKVIYTTHSAGCLPEDLGAGVRLVVPSIEKKTSSIKNKFWRPTVPGFSPLLYGMGAASLAFFPVRKALAVEGQADMLLLPTLIRQATGRDYLGFQIIPGLSETSLLALPAMESVGNGVAYFVDADGGGDDLKRQLLTLGVDQQRIFQFDRPSDGTYTLEDMIDAQLFADAVNTVLDKYYSEAGAPKLKASDIELPSRVGKLETWLNANGINDVPKVEIAYQLLDDVAENPLLRIIDGNFENELSSLHEQVCSAIDALAESGR